MGEKMNEGIRILTMAQEGDHLTNGLLHTGEAGPGNSCGLKLQLSLSKADVLQAR